MRVGVPGLPVTLVHARLYPFLISFIIEAVIQVIYGWGGPGLPVTLVHARLYPFLISFIIGAVIQVGWG